MYREFQTEIYVRTKFIRNNFWREPSAENKTAYKKNRGRNV